MEVLSKMSLSNKNAITKKILNDLSLIRDAKTEMKEFLDEIENNEMNDNSDANNGIESENENEMNNHRINKNNMIAQEDTKQDESENQETNKENKNIQNNTIDNISNDIIQPSNNVINANNNNIDSIMPENNNNIINDSNNNNNNNNNDNSGLNVTDLFDLLFEIGDNDDDDDDNEQPIMLDHNAKLKIKKVFELITFVCHTLSHIYLFLLKVFQGFVFFYFKFFCLHVSKTCAYTHTAHR